MIKLICQIISNEAQLIIKFLRWVYNIYEQEKPVKVRWKYGLEKTIWMILTIH